MLHETFIEFGKLALMNAQRISFHVSEFFPSLEAIMIVVSDAGMLLGARVYFEPPCKSVWVKPDGECVYGPYDQERKTEAPLTATYYVFTDPNNLTDPVVYANPAT